MMLARRDSEIFRGTDSKGRAKTPRTGEPRLPLPGRISHVAEWDGQEHAGERNALPDVARSPLGAVDAKPFSSAIKFAASPWHCSTRCSRLASTDAAGVHRGRHRGRGEQSSSIQSPGMQLCARAPPSPGRDPPNGSCSRGPKSTRVSACLNPTWICPNVLLPISPLPNAASSRHAGIKSSFNNSMVSSGK